MSRILRFNRVEGLFTGVAPSVNFRSVAPGLSAGVFAGWAWSEQTARGGAFVSLRRANAIYGIRTDRTLASTNDFTPPLADDPGLGALFGSLDDFDYVDRRSAALSVARVLGSLDRGIASVQLGVVGDRAERARISRGLFGSEDFRFNRGVDEGTSMVMSADLELHPNVTGEFVQPGLGARAHIETGRGDLDWTRSELRLIGRKYLGPVTIVAQADGGIVTGDSPPSQKLFELGGDLSLPGYDYKQFVGDRAALFRLFTSYRFNIWQRPRRVWRNFLMPGVSPGIGVSVQGGWAELSSTGASVAASRLTPFGSPAPQPTNGARTTVGAGLTFFSDLLHVGVARPVDRAARLRFVAGFGTVF
jgi:hypothetical protein